MKHELSYLYYAKHLKSKYDSSAFMEFNTSRTKVGLKDKDSWSKPRSPLDENLIKIVD